MKSPNEASKNMVTDIDNNRVRLGIRVAAGVLAILYIPVMLISLRVEGLSGYKFQVPAAVWASIFLFVAITGRGPSWLR